MFDQPTISRRQALRTAAAGALIPLCGIADAQQPYPAKTIRLVVPFGAGGASDMAARVHAQDLSIALKQPVVVDNVVGGSGMIGASAVAKAPADGYTLLLQTNVHVINPALRKKMLFDTVADFTPIAELGEFSPFILFVNASSDIKTLADYVAKAKTSNGGPSVASSGVGTTPHLVAEMFATQTKTRFVHVPYNVSSGQIRSVVAGDAESTWAGVQAAMPFIKDGKLRPLGIASASRSPLMPNIATITEQGISGVVIDTWYGLFGPAKMPAPIVELLSSTAIASLQTADTKARLAAMGVEPAPRGPAAFRRLIDDELVMYRKLVQASNISIDE